MNHRVKILSEAAAKLTPEERIELVEEIDMTLRDYPPETDAVFEAEIDRRVSEIDAGEVALLDFDEVLRGLREMP